MTARLWRRQMDFLQRGVEKDQDLTYCCGLFGTPRTAMQRRQMNEEFVEDIQSGRPPWIFIEVSPHCQSVVLKSRDQRKQEFMNYALLGGKGLRRFTYSSRMSTRDTLLRFSRDRFLLDRKPNFARVDDQFHGSTGLSAVTCEFGWRTSDFFEGLTFGSRGIFERALIEI
jgi:hypothetical protein